MNNTLSINVSLSFNNANGATLLAGKNFTTAPTGPDYLRATVNIGTTTTALDLDYLGYPVGWAPSDGSPSYYGSVPPIGWVLIENMDSTGTNTLSLSSDGVTFPSPLNINPGEFILLRWHGTAIFIKSYPHAQEAQISLIDS